MFLSLLYQGCNLFSTPVKTKLSKFTVLHFIFRILELAKFQWSQKIKIQFDIKNNAR